MKESVIILSANKYNFTSDKGDQVAGVTIQYISGEQENESNRRGMFPTKISVPTHYWNDIKVLPGAYEMEFTMRPGAGGKPVLTLIGLKYLTPISINNGQKSEA